MRNKFIANDNILFSLNEKKEFFNSFYYMYKSGLPVIEIFRSLINSSSSIKIKQFCSIILNNIENGYSIKEAFKGYSEVLGIAYTTLLTAGEEAGKLEDVLSGILDALNREEDIKNKIISSVSYPACIFFLAIGVWLLFKFFILKIFASIGEDINIPLLAISAIIKIVIVYGIILGVLAFIFFNKKFLRKFLDFISSLVIFSNLMKNFYFLNFFNVMALAYESGIMASEALYLGNSVIKLPKVNIKLRNAQKSVQHGSTISKALAASGVFPGSDISQISAGEQAGELDKIFKVLSHNYENKLNLALKSLLKLIEPLLILLIGIFVAYIAVKAYSSYYSAIFSML